MSTTSEGRRWKTGLARIVVFVAILLGAEGAAADLVVMQILGLNRIYVGGTTQVELYIQSTVELPNIPFAVRFTPTCELANPCRDPVFRLLASPIPIRPDGSGSCDSVRFEAVKRTYSIEIRSIYPLTLPEGRPCRIFFTFSVEEPPGIALPHKAFAVLDGSLAASAIQEVEVRAFASPGAEIQDLMKTIEAMNLPDGAQASLTAPLDAACNKMDTFAKRVMGSRELTQPQLDRLLIEGQKIQDHLGC